MNAKPRSADESEPILKVNKKDIEDIFSWCHSMLPDSNSPTPRYRR